MPKKKPKNKWVLVDDWKCAWTWISTNCMALVIAIQGTWAMLDADMRSSIPKEYVTGLTISLLMLGIVGRLVKKEPCK